MGTEVISAWDVYWVLQLDSIRSLMQTVCGLATLGAGAAIVVCTFEHLDGEEWAGPMRRTFLRLFAAGLLGVSAASFLPSSQTAAAMIVLPAIANNQTLQQEAGELYGLAKKALRDEAGEKPEAAK